MGIMVEETWINATEGHGIGESGIYEAHTDHAGELYRAMRRKYGRCVSKVYVDTEDGVKAIGWVFVKRQKYEDTGERYLQETWVTLHESLPTRTVEHHYHTI